MGKKVTSKTTKKPSKKTTAKKSNSKPTSGKNKKLKKASTSTKKTPSTKSSKKTLLPKLSKEKKQIKKENQSRDKQLLEAIIEGMQEKKAKNITILDLQSIENSFCNYFVICEAESKPQLQAITDSVEEFTRKKLSIKPHHTEGVQNAEWILLDYLTVVAHIFRSDVREFYKLEELWADAKTEHIPSY